MMDSNTLKNIQAPLKELYRAHAEKAMITLKAKGSIGENVSCKLETGRSMVEAGLHPATGGTGMLACSGDMLLEALVACAGVTLNAVSTSLGIKLTRADISAEGDLDFRGTLGVSKEVPVGFKTIRLTFHLESTASTEEIQKLITLTERYCVVYQTLKNSVPIQVQ